MKSHDELMLGESVFFGIAWIVHKIGKLSIAFVPCYAEGIETDGFTVCLHGPGPNNRATGNLKSTSVFA